MSSPSDFGLAEFVLMNGEVYTEETDLETFLEFVMGNVAHWRFDMPADEQGIEKHHYVPHHGVQEFIWHDHQLARKRRQKGKKR